MKKIQLLALISGILTLFLVFNMNKGEQQKEAIEIIKKPVVQAVADIVPYTEITAEMIQLVEMEESSIHPDAIFQTEEIIGKITTMSILAGEPVLNSKLCERESAAAGLAMQVTPGKRAISLAVDLPNGLASNLRVGNRVDLLVSVDVEMPEEELERYNQLILEYPEYFSLFRGQDEKKGEEEPEAASIPGFAEATFVEASVLMQNISVLALDTRITKDFIPTADEAGYATVTLEVELEQAVLIELVENYDDIRLVLREQNDHEIKNAEVIKSGQVFNKNPFSDLPVSESQGGIN